MEVRIKHLKANDWSGQTRYPNCFDALGPYFTRSGMIYTGLTKEDATRLGEILGKDLNPGSSFWDTFRIRIGSESIVLNPDNDAFDELKYLFLKGHKRVAISLHDRKPTANYYISVADQEADISNTYNRTRRKAYVEFDKMTEDEIKKCLRVYGYKADNVSAAVAEARLNDLVDQNPQKFFEKWVDNKHRITEFLVKDAVAKAVIRKNKNMYSYGTSTLGNSLEDAIAYLDSLENSDIKTTIINEVNVK